MSRTFLLVFVGCTLWSSSNAHETWIAAERRSGTRGGPLAVVITSGTHFPIKEIGLSRNVLAKSGVRLGGESRPFVPFAELERMLVARAPIASDGVATLWLVLDPQPVTLSPQQVDAYLEEINADPSVRQAWSEDPTRQWHERYEKFAKQIVRVGEGRDEDRTWAIPVGGALELIPESDPTLVKAGDLVALRLLKHGRPLAGQMVSCTDGVSRDWRRTDSEGRVRFTLHRRGPWLVHATELKRTEEGWRSWFTTLTIGSGATARPTGE